MTWESYTLILENGAIYETVAILKELVHHEYEDV